MGKQTELQDFGDPIELRINDKQISQMLGAIFSRGNLALRVRRIVGGSGTYTLNEKDSVIFVDSPTTNVTLTFPQPNYWGTNRSPVFLVFGVSLGANTITLTTGTGAFNGTTALPAAGGQTGAIVFSDGSTNYYGGVF